MRRYIDRRIGTGCNFGIAWLRSNRLNPSDSHLLSMARLLVSARITSHHLPFLRLRLLLFLLSLEGSIVPRIIRHRPHQRTLAPRLPRSPPRKKRLRRNMPYSPRWSHRHYFSSLVALSGKLSQRTQRVKQPPALTRRHGTQIRSGAFSKGRQLLRSSTLSQTRRWALHQSAHPSQPSPMAWRRGSARKIPVSLPY